MRRAHVFIAIAGLTSAACASSSGAGRLDQGTSQQSTVYSGTDGPTIMADRPHASTYSIAKPTDVVWAAAKKVYADLAVPLVVDNAATHQLGNSDFYKMRQIGGKAMSEFMDCGSGMTGPFANSYRIYMSLLSTVVPDGKGGTAVATTFAPSAVDMSGTSASRVQCLTNGRLESLINDRIIAITGP